MNNNDIYQKSDLGREEVKNQSLGVLPREARTLLIMIDGKKTYRNYLNSLDSSKMFADFGGITPLFELLLEFQCIELVGQAGTTSLQQTSALPKRVEPARADAASTLAFNENTSLNQSPRATELQASQTKQSQRDSEAEFESMFNNKQTDTSAKTADSVSIRQKPDANYETLKSSLATAIEKNAPPEEAWGYLLNLEQCADTAQLLALAQDIQRSSGGHLSRSMGDLFNKYNRHF